MSAKVRMGPLQVAQSFLWSPYFKLTLCAMFCFLPQYIISRWSAGAKYSLSSHRRTRVFEDTHETSVAERLIINIESFLQDRTQAHKHTLLPSMLNFYERPEGSS